MERELHSNDIGEVFDFFGQLVELVHISYDGGRQMAYIRLHEGTEDFTWIDSSFLRPK